MEKILKATDLQGAFLNLNTGHCPNCGASHANESVCHSCDYIFKDLLNHK